MSTPESLAPKTPFEEMAAEIDQHRYRSDPYHWDMDEYYQIIQMGEAVLPDLLASGPNGLWKMDVIREIATAIGRPIELPPEGTVVTTEGWRQTLVMWGIENGYIDTEPPIAKI